MRVQELWLNGVCFFDAWDAFATAREQKELRTAKDAGAIDSRRLLMQANMIARLNNGELVAFGIRVEDKPYRGPERIPAALFNDNRDNVHKVFSASDRQVRLSGRTWSSVTVLISSDDCNLVAKAEPKRIGRPSVEKELDEVVEALMAEDAFASCVSKKQHMNIVIKRAQQSFPKLFPKATQPAPATIRKALDRFAAAMRAESKSQKGQK